ncbi:Na+/H+ antiporter NhaA [Spirillospora sp. NPDC048823]|uniref:Na+/H+ antiporter NhaA n=1 Tax=unclassified Spirillospora TaxID=2642701 RepID=UPI0037223307
MEQPTGRGPPPWSVGSGGLHGAGSTVSLLIGGLAYTDPSQFERVTTAVLIASIPASAAAAVVFRRRVRLRARPD